MLKLIYVTGEKGLREYLELWMKMKLNPDQTSQQIMLLTWIIELFANQLNSTKHKVQLKQDQERESLGKNDPLGLPRKKGGLQDDDISENPYI